MLKIMPDLTFPITATSVNPLMDNLVQLNSLDAGLQEAQQRALVIHLHCWDLFIKTKGKVDYRGVDGHERLKEDAVKFVASQIVTRRGDLAAAHLAMDWHDTTLKSMAANLPIPTNDVHALVSDCRDLAGLSLEMEKRVSLLMDMLGKKSPGI